MSGPRGDDGSDDRPFDDRTWHEPTHLGGASGQPSGAGSWEPEGWSLPPADPQRRLPEPAGVESSPAWTPPPVDQLPYGMPTAEDPFGLRSWALRRGWTVSDGTGPQDAVLTDLLATGPVRLGKEHRPAGVLRGRYGLLDLVAFDVVFPLGRSLRYTHAVTAAPLLGAVPRLRLSPARLWKHRTTGLLQIPSGDADLDLRWTLLAAEDGPQVRRLAQDPTVRGLLLGSDDGDEFWTAAGHVAAIRPDGHRPQLLEHHARLLTAVVAGLSAG
jgi:hypothetical protein